MRTITSVKTWQIILWVRFFEISLLPDFLVNRQLQIFVKILKTCVFYANLEAIISKNLTLFFNIKILINTFFISHLGVSDLHKQLLADYWF